MKKIVLIALVLLVMVGCTSTPAAQPTPVPTPVPTPEPTPDVPKFAKGEAIGLVHGVYRQCGQLPIHGMREFGLFEEEYIGDGIWEVKYFNTRLSENSSTKWEFDKWHVYESSSAVREIIGYLCID